MALSSTHAIRFGSIVAGIAWLVLLFAPGSRAEDAAPRETVGASAKAASDPSTTTSAPSTVAGPTIVPTTAGPAPVPAPTSAPTTAKPGVPLTTAPRVYSVLDLVGVSIERGTTWIAIATVTVVDQTGSPAAAVDVTATWSVENTAASCRTDAAGKCSMYRSGLPANIDSVTITTAVPQPVAKTIRRPGVS